MPENEPLPDPYVGAPIFVRRNDEDAGCYLVGIVTSLDEEGGVVEALVMDDSGDVSPIMGSIPLATNEAAFLASSSRIGLLPPTSSRRVVIGTPG